MTGAVPSDFADLWSRDRARQNAAYTHILAVTDEPVGWAYDVWDETVRQLASKDNHDRAIAAQLLSNLAKSDPERRILGDFDVLFAITRDHRFVTARHGLKSLWKVGAAGDEQRALLVTALEDRYRTCIGEKNATLIRYDIVEILRTLYDAVGDERVKAKALELVEAEDDEKYRKKYAGLWKGR